VGEKKGCFIRAKIGTRHCAIIHLSCGRINVNQLTIWRAFMLKTVQGTYKNGQIELAEVPKGIRESAVFVTFLENKIKGWSDIILQHQSISDFITFESYRDELIPPQELTL
jgi:hypothetical protein